MTQEQEAYMPTLQEEYRAQREKLATGYGFGDFIDMFATPIEPPVFLSVGTEDNIKDSHEKYV